ECLTGHGSMDAWQRLTPDVSLVLLDLMMPGESGPAILRRMQMDPTLAKIPVIFMSGRADAATRIQCLAMGAHGFITKPFEAEALLARVRAMVAPAKDERPADGEDDPLAAALGLDPGTSGSGSLDALLAGASESTRQIVQGLLGERQALKRR